MLRRLQTLYGKLAAHTLEESGRAARMEWATNQLQHPVKSFGELSQDDAITLVDRLQSQLGIRAPSKKRLSRHDAYKAGTDGRRGNSSSEITMASAADLDRIHRVLDMLGWNQAQFQAWLQSSKSPLSRRSTPQVQSLADANRVYWALKGMAKHRGLWKGK